MLIQERKRAAKAATVNLTVVVSTHMQILLVHVSQHLYLYTNSIFEQLVTVTPGWIYFLRDGLNHSISLEFGIRSRNFDESEEVRRRHRRRRRRR